jgi:DNA gyrase subunit A
MKLGKGDRVIGAVVLRRAGTTILVATEKGFGKRSDTEEYRISHRGGKGIITVKTTDKTGDMIAIKEVIEKEDVVIVTSRGVVIRQHAADIRVAGRNTQGVRLIKLDQGDAVSDVAAVPTEDEEPSSENAEAGEKGSPQQDLFDAGGKSRQAAKTAPPEAEHPTPAAGRKSTGKGDRVTKRPAKKAPPPRKNKRR